MGFCPQRREIKRITPHPITCTRAGHPLRNAAFFNHLAHTRRCSLVLHPEHPFQLIANQPNLATPNESPLDVSLIALCYLTLEPLESLFALRIATVIIFGDVVCHRYSAAVFSSAALPARPTVGSDRHEYYKHTCNGAYDNGVADAIDVLQQFLELGVCHADLHQ